MKVLHTADLHLDRSFEGLKKIPEMIYEKMQQANQNTVSAIVDIAIKNQVDVVIFAGDTFHQSHTSIRTQAYFIDEMKRLEQADIPVIMTFGNHDYYVAERYWFEFPENIFLFQSEQVETHYFMTKNQEKVAVSSFSYEHPWINENKLSDFPVKDTTVDIHIGIYHGDTAVNEQQNYAPFSLSEMKAKGYDYWALGHIHQPQVVSANPLIVYPGTPQGHTKKERTVQGVSLVSVEAGHATVRFESVAEIVWQHADYSLAEATNLQDALTFLATALLAEVKVVNQIVLKEINLEKTSHLGEEFKRSYESGELLHYLQEMLLRKSNHELFLFQVDISVDDFDKKVLIDADPELLRQLEKNYLQSEIFTNTLQELIQNPLFSSVIQVDKEWRQRSIEQADQKINEDFVIQEGQP
ncbi:metallophosphoesterase family protein [Enterococcus sp. 5H]|uniref:metallophosphoesterase family protein n=1 Tax=Enterococcus sp. 5H TaxID=1229490 RepID=UPI002302260E|nr:DNA repair exonuclease [Enterococcus sp. 5H]MDA9470471.1 DNA double-strand break repair protein Mre11 [Enterococcus sp. 5H]